MELFKVKFKDVRDGNHYDLFANLGLDHQLTTLSEYIFGNLKEMQLYNHVINPSEYQFVTIENLKDMVVLKRNDVGDATHYDSHITTEKINCILIGEWWNAFTGGKWQQHCYVSSGRAEYMKPIKEGEMKEYLDKDYNLIKINTYPHQEIHESWIEVPKGAIKLIGNSRHKHFVSEDGKFMADYDIKNGKGYWYEPSMTLGSFLKVADGSVLWSRYQSLNDQVVTAELARQDNVNHPSHYTSDPSGIECIEVTRHRNFNIGNAMKYLWRNGLKDSDSQIQDLEKAIWYIQDEIKRLNGEQNGQ